MSGALKCLSIVRPQFFPNFSVRFIKIRRKKFPLPEEVKYKSQEKSLAAKGFLRSFKPYTPPQDAADTVQVICNKLGIQSDPDFVIEDAVQKFSLLKECFVEFKHSVPNSVLHAIETVGDIQKFYETPVDTTVPYDAFRDMDLPPNLHIQYDYVRFHPDKDTMFGGISAFPGNSTLVTGLKSRKKYEGFTACSPWDTYKQK